MRILQLIDSLQTGGAERTSVNYANLLVGLVDESYLCATRMEGALKNTLHKNVGYLFLNKKSSMDFNAIKTLNVFVKTHNINLVHAHSTSYVQVAILKLFNRNIKVIWHDHNGNRGSNGLFENIVLKACSLFFNAVIVVNTSLKLWAEKNLFVKKIYYLSNFSVLKGENQHTTLKGKQGKRIVCVANLKHPKNHILLLEAFENILKKTTDWSLHLIGEDFKDAYSNQIKVFIDENGLNQNVFVYGLKEDISYILSQCEIGVLSSSSEGLPLSLVEYGLAKLAVVATNVGDCNKVISKKTEGILVNPDDVDAFSKGLLKYINNKDKRKQAGEMLYKHVANNFSAKKNVEQLISIYNKV
ncbi:glycosyltransferase family 4 protein [Hwangdonia lutea]|uniref:Glycosyltransferase family 4 protein n=1 Tax=Hwangdonia lutea TaxID=3075823 RepID=A0AA97EM61_9FLAO|nr:glycosyltransferase family 4 protein [Hwangdonia sp. SCSIO 19198]WOD43961.1 glycosyltransferase family 4 protein [Hwangdonia sp. SCSIO 19198]